MLWKLQNLPQSVPNPSKIEPGERRDAAKPAKSDNKGSKKRKTRPGSAQERKIVPTWLQQGLTVFGRRDGWAPPKVVKTGI